MTELTLGNKIRQLQGLVGTKDVRPQDGKFIVSMMNLSEGGKKTSHLTGPQVEYLNNLWTQHYGGYR